MGPALTASGDCGSLSLSNIKPVRKHEVSANNFNVIDNTELLCLLLPVGATLLLTCRVSSYLWHTPANMLQCCETIAK